ncbi:RING-type domain-containing protein [Meloidogyne graminicola]|uniref:RING-type domain-containing protein n=1 Tax=Meloidogyne graminicola TaxID=189291 RepID=A0A8T0A350_9BILA|nr:RING-type domain-containing protein [Meloidogyne graminicola]
MKDIQKQCVVCRTNKTWRIKMRGAENKCGHIVCVNCMLQHLQKWIKKDKARIKCPMENCLERVHENDIYALLSSECEDLDNYMDFETRNMLLIKHETCVIKYGLGERSRCCPRCENLYGQKVGCNYVRCANLYCNTWFCWICGKEDINWTHFTDFYLFKFFKDILKGLYIVSFLLFTGGLILTYFMPAVAMGLFLIAPTCVTFATPFFILKYLKNIWRRLSTTKLEIWQLIICWTLFAFLYVLFIPFGIVAAILSLNISVLVFTIYVLMVVIKAVPFLGQVMWVLEMIQYICGCFGFGGWLDWYKHSREKKDRRQRALMQFRAERSERMANPLVGR